MAKADARKAKEPPRQALDTIKRLSGAVLSSRDEQRLYDAHRAILRAYRALLGSGAAPGPRWAAPVEAALRYLGGDSDQHSRSLKSYDHHQYGPFLGVSDDGDSAEAIRRAAHDSPKAVALGRGMVGPTPSAWHSMPSGSAESARCPSAPTSSSTSGANVSTAP